MPILTDTVRLDWLIAALCLADDDDEVAAKAERFATALVSGKRGRDAIDAAMKEEARGEQ